MKSVYVEFEYEMWYECAETAHEGNAAVAAVAVDAARRYGTLGHQRLLQQQPGDATATGADDQTSFGLWEETGHPQQSRHIGQAQKGRRTRPAGQSPLS
jgi:hypothetical protein